VTIGLVLLLSVGAVLGFARQDPREQAGRGELARSPARPVEGTPRKPPPPRRPLRLERIEVGRGARGAAVVRPSELEGPQPGVVLLHGWGEVERSDYRGWIRHLAQAGNTVIVPRYQRSAQSPPDRVLANALAGVRSSLRRAPIAPGSLVVAGHSAGAALAADYAGSARREGLPRPRAVFAAYPGRIILGYPGGIPAVDPSAISARTRILAMAGANDRVVAQAPARELIRSAVNVPTRRKRFILVQDPAVDDHGGPQRAGRAARRIFWARLDRLIALARRSRDAGSGG